MNLLEDSFRLSNFSKPVRFMQSSRTKLICVVVDHRPPRPLKELNKRVLSRVVRLNKARKSSI